MSAVELTEPPLRRPWLGYFGRREQVGYEATCERCGRLVPLASYTAREWVCLGRLPFWPLARWRLLDVCAGCGYQRRLPLSDFRAWCDEQVTPEREALQAQPEDADARLLLLTKLHSLGRHDAAAALVAPLLAAGIDSAELALTAGQVLGAAGRPAAALAAFRAAVIAAPERADCQLALGRALAGTRQLALAAHHLEAATRLAPEEAAAWRRLARVQFRRREWPAALAAWDRAAEIDPRLRRTSAYRWQTRLARWLAR